MSAEPGMPRTPVTLGWTGWRTVIRDSGRGFVRNNCNLSAWSLACRGFLALFPALIAVLGLVQLLHPGGTDARKLISSIDKNLPPGASDVFSQAVTAASHRSTSASVTALVGGVLVALWSVSGAIDTLQIALDVTYEVPARRFVARRLRSFSLILATVTLGIVASALSVFGASIGNALHSHAPFGGTAFTIAWTIIRWLVALTAITLLLGIYYSYGPNRQAGRWRWTSLGSAIAATIFVLASLGFSFYVANFGSYGKIYGAFAGVVILIIWLYLGALAVLLGAEINAQAEREGLARVTATKS